MSVFSTLHIENAQVLNIKTGRQSCYSHKLLLVFAGVFTARQRSLNQT